MPPVRCQPPEDVNHEPVHSPKGVLVFLKEGQPIMHECETLLREHLQPCRRGPSLVEYRRAKKRLLWIFFILALLADAVIILLGVWLVYC